jgi:aminoglycoside phosphotransferase (APT) family kinase protein
LTVGSVDPAPDTAPDTAWDSTLVADGIAELLGSHLPQASDVRVSDVARVFGGNARRAWSATACWQESGRSRTEELILLVRQPGAQVRTDPRWEFAVLDGLAEKGVRAPRVRGHDPDGYLFGSPAVLLERLPGSADAVAYLGADAQTGRARTLDLARAAAELHAVQPALDGRELDGVELDGVELDGESQLALWHGQFLAARLEPHPTLGWLFDWLTDRQVTPSRPVLVHGDFRPGNVLYERDRIVGLLDWEMAHVGDPAEDLAWAYRKLWSPERFVPIEEFVAAYTEAGGVDISVESLRWHRVFCEVKFATISVLAARSVVDGTSHNLRLIDRNTTVLPAVRRCLAWIGESAAAHTGAAHTGAAHTGAAPC